MMKRTLFLLLTLLVFAAPAQALKLVVMDAELEERVAYGEMIAGKFAVKFDKDYSGRIVALFNQTDEEKAKGTFSGLQNRYEGVLRGGQLLLDPDSPATSSRSAAPAASQGKAARIMITLPKLLQPYKISVTVQPTSQLPPVTNVLLVGR